MSADPISRPRHSPPTVLTPAWLPLAAVGIIFLFAAGAVILAQVRIPHSDEGHFASGAWEFANHHRLAFPMWTEWVASLDYCMYVTMPLYFVQLGLWSQLSGYDISALRFNSVAWGVLLNWSWFSIVTNITRNCWTGILALILIALNYDVMNTASGRYDPMAAALNAAGAAVYLALRERRLGMAVFLGNCLLAASCVTHPYAVFGLAWFAVLFTVLDRHRFSLKILAAAMIPYVFAFGGWGIYIAQHPLEFRAQMSANATGRLSALSHPIEAISSEINIRYLQLFAGFGRDVPIYMRMKILIILAYAAGFLGCLTTRSIRSDRGKLAIVVIGFVSALFLMFLEGHRWYIYLIHALPAYSAVLALWLADLAGRGSRWRVLVMCGVTLFCCYSFATVGYRLRINDYKTIYQPTLEYLAAQVGGDDLVMGPGELGTRVGFRAHLLDDASLGARNGLYPKWVVVDASYQESITRRQAAIPGLASHAAKVLGQADLVFERGSGTRFYRVYRVRDRASGGG